MTWGKMVSSTLLGLTCLNPAFGQENKTPQPKLSSPFSGIEKIDPGLRAEFGMNGEMTYYKRVGQKYEPISEVEFQNSINDLMQKALRFACNLAVIPYEVNASVNVLSVTWKLDEKLCGKFKT